MVEFLFGHPPDFPVALSPPVVSLTPFFALSVAGGPPRPILSRYSARIAVPSGPRAWHIGGQFVPQTLWRRRFWNLFPDVPCYCGRFLDGKSRFPK